MALTDPLQWVVIAVVAVVFLMYGPKKIPELARSIGKARNEFKQASDTVNEVGGTLRDPDKLLSTLERQAPPPAPSVPPAQVPTDGDPLLSVAKKLGISTAGKTKEEISEEIVSRSGSAASK